MRLPPHARRQDRKSTRLNSSHDQISYAVFCLKKKNRLGRLAAGETPADPRQRWRRAHARGGARPVAGVPPLAASAGRGLVRFRFFFFNDTATTEIYTLSLHDALPI